MEQKVYINHWKNYHSSLAPETAKEFKRQIEKILGISQSAFYRKIKTPQQYLTIAEKMAIARVYKLKEAFLFPELGDDSK